MAAAKKTATKKVTKRVKKEEPFVLDPAIVYVLTRRRWFVTQVVAVYPSRAKAEAELETFKKQLPKYIWTLSPSYICVDNFDVLIKGN